MNLPHSGLMDAVQAASLTSDIDGLLTLGVPPVSVDFSTPSSDTVIDWSTGAVSRTTTDDSITGYLSALTSREVAEMDGAVAGDLWLLVMQADLTEPPSLDSYATANSKRYKVLTVETPPLSSHYRMRVRVHA